MLKYGPMRTVVERLGYFMPSGRARVKLECGHFATTHNAGIRKAHCAECLQERDAGAGYPFSEQGGAAPGKAKPMLIASMDTPEIRNWIVNASERGGSFVRLFAQAAQHADWQNYEILRPALMVIRAKYPAYESASGV